MNKQTLKLSKPITAHGEEIDTLEFSEPTTEMVIRIGQPMNYMRDGSIEGAVVDTTKCAKYLSRLANIPENSVKQMAPKDFNKAIGIIVNLVVGDDQGNAEEEAQSE